MTERPLVRWTQPGPGAVQTASGSVALGSGDALRNLILVSFFLFLLGKLLRVGAKGSQDVRCNICTAAAGFWVDGNLDCLLPLHDNFCFVSTFLY